MQLKFGQQQVFGSWIKLVLVLIGLGASVSASLSAAAAPVVTTATEIKVMHYNLENFFDSRHDEGHADYEFLPANDPLKSECNKSGTSYQRKACLKTDWTETRFQLKLQQTKQVIDAQGSLPDILSVVEIENENVISQLGKVLGYQHQLITNGRDGRGINVGVLYNEKKLKFLKSRTLALHYSTDEFESKPTRDILAVYFQTKSRQSETFAVYINHWPSQAAPAKKRYETATQLIKAIREDQQTFGSGLKFVITGDFNTIDSDAPNGLNYMRDQLGLTDIQVSYDETYCKQDPEHMCQKMPAGTFFYGHDRTWNRLDRFYVASSMMNQGAGLRAEPETFRIFAEDFMVKHYQGSGSDWTATEGTSFLGEPKHYEPNADTSQAAGYSDHFPIIIKMSL